MLKYLILKDLSYVILLLFVLYSCTYDGRNECIGKPTIQTAIDSASVTLEANIYIINLSGNEHSLFKHTNGDEMNFNISSNLSIQQRKKSNQKGIEAVVNLTEKGTFDISIFASDVCEAIEKYDFQLIIN